MLKNKKILGLIILCLLVGVSAFLLFKPLSPEAKIEKCLKTFHTVREPDQIDAYNAEFDKAMRTENIDQIQEACLLGVEDLFTENGIEQVIRNRMPIYALSPAKRLRLKIIPKEIKVQPDLSSKLSDKKAYRFTMKVMITSLTQDEVVEEEISGNVNMVKEDGQWKIDYLKYKQIPAIYKGLY